MKTAVRFIALICFSIHTVPSVWLCGLCAQTTESCQIPVSVCADDEKVMACCAAETSSCCPVEQSPEPACHADVSCGAECSDVQQGCQFCECPLSDPDVTPAWIADFENSAVCKAQPNALISAPSIEYNANDLLRAGIPPGISRSISTTVLRI